MKGILMKRYTVAFTMLLTFALLIIAPFNIFKYALTSLIVFVIYKKIRVVLKGD